jgi:hypothetical protein
MMLLKQFGELDFDAEALETIILPYHQALNDIDKANAVRRSPDQGSQGCRSE